MGDVVKIGEFYLMSVHTSPDTHRVLFLGGMDGRHFNKLDWYPPIRRHSINWPGVAGPMDDHVGHPRLYLHGDELRVYVSGYYSNYWRGINVFRYVK